LKAALVLNGKEVDGRTIRVDVSNQTERSPSRPRSQRPQRRQGEERTERPQRNERYERNERPQRRGDTNERRP